MEMDFDAHVRGGIEMDFDAHVTGGMEMDFDAHVRGGVEMDFDAHVRGGVEMDFVRGGMEMDFDGPLCSIGTYHIYIATLTVWCISLCTHYTPTTHSPCGASRRR
jgi:hypothetical protein